MSIETNFGANVATALEISIEDRLLLHFSRLSLSSASLSEIKELMNNDITWEYVFEKAMAHGIFGLICLHHQTHHLNLPTRILHKLSRNVGRLRRHAHHLLREVAEISTAIAPAKIPVVILKGPALVSRVYSSRSLRPFGDIDLLVHTKHIPKLENLLLKLGYSQVVVDRTNESYRLKTSMEMNQTRVGSLHWPPLTRIRNVNPHFNKYGPDVDIHHTELRLGAIRQGAIVEAAHVDYGFGAGLRVPTYEDLIIYSCYHFYRHFRLTYPTFVSTSYGGYLANETGALKFLADIYASLSVYFANNGDWYNLCRRAAQISAEEILFYGLYYIDLIYGKGTVPDEALGTFFTSESFQVPLINDAVHVNSEEELIRTHFRTQNGSFGPETWILHPRKVCGRIMESVKIWRRQNRSWPSAKCTRLKGSDRLEDLLLRTNSPRVDGISLDPKLACPDQFFLTHVTGGVWDRRDDLRANTCLFWNDHDFCVTTSVESSHLHYPESDLIGCGENIAIYISDSDYSLQGKVIKRIAVSILKDNTWASPRPPAFSSVGYVDVDADCLNVDLRTSKGCYYIGVYIPWNVLGIVPSFGLHFGFDIEIIHRYPDQNLKTALAWSGGEFLSQVHPAVHGVVTLTR